MKCPKLHLRNLFKRSLMMWTLKEMQVKQTLVYISCCHMIHDKDSTRTINHKSILTVNKSDSLHVDGGFGDSIYPYETISCLCILQQSVVRFTTIQHIALLLLLLLFFFYCLRNIYIKTRNKVCNLANKFFEEESVFSIAVILQFCCLVSYELVRKRFQ
jgi:hypothetical protein